MNPGQSIKVLLTGWFSFYNLKTKMDVDHSEVLDGVSYMWTSLILDNRNIAFVEDVHRKDR